MELIRHEINKAVIFFVPFFFYLFTYKDTENNERLQQK